MNEVLRISLYKYNIFGSFHETSEDVVVDSPCKCFRNLDDLIREREHEKGKQKLANRDKKIFLWRLAFYGLLVACLFTFLVWSLR